MKNLNSSLPCSPSSAAVKPDVYQTFSFSSTTGHNWGPSGQPLSGTPFFTVSFKINQTALALHGKFTSFLADPSSGQPAHSGYDYWSYQNLPNRMSHIVTGFSFTVAGATLGDGAYTSLDSDVYYAKLGSYDSKADLSTPISAVRHGFGGFMAVFNDGTTIYDFSVSFWDPSQVTELDAHSRVFFCMTVKSATSLDVLATSIGETAATPNSSPWALGAGITVPAPRTENRFNAPAMQA